jgi:hypothetical protein
VNKAISMHFVKGLVSTKINLWLNGQALFDPVFKYLNGILMTLKLIYQIKATQGITGLIKIRAHIKLRV